ncbi:hypothetical protein GO299_00267 [Ralstonia solanacearum]|nr:hypothetical protein [Ralstonia solanacearum]NKF68072.1 hypothetical protein [Ralstonia solanacearum]
MVNIVANPVPLFVNTSGVSVNNGTLYVGAANVDPVKNPISVFQDSGMTTPLPQPIGVQAGMPSLNGTPIQLFTAQSNFSMTVFDSAGNLVMSMPNVSAVAQLPPISGIIPKRYVAGVDFTPGVTTQLSLPTNPGAVSNIWIFFDSAYQADDQVQSLNGSTLTFNAPIPVGVQEVNIKCGTQLAIGTPGAGSVGDTQLSWGSILNRVVDSLSALAGLNTSIYTRAFATGYSVAGDGGGGNYSYNATTPQSSANGVTIVASTVSSGCWILSQTTVLSVKHFGAKGDGVTDDTNAIQAALNWAATGGKLLRVPAGLYIMTAGVSATLNNGTPINSGGLRLTMIGDGPGSTCFQYASGASPTLFTFTGNYADRFLLEGFRVQHTDQADVSSNGIGVSLIGQVNTVMRDVNFFRMTTGVSATDINSCEFNNCVFNYNFKGFTAAIGSVTYPNAIAFRNCYFSSNYQYGAAVTSGVTCTFDGCTFEANGLDNSGVVQPSAAALAFSNNGVNGAASLRVLGCYFEHNAGAADIYVTHTATGSYVLQGNTFNRIDSVQYVTNNVVFDASALGAGSAPCKVELSGNGFTRAGTYAANSAHRYINYASGANFDQFYVDDDGTNNYQDSIELPLMDATRVSQYGAVSQVQARAYVTVSGGVATMQNNTGIVSVTRASVGVFNVSLKRTAGSLALPQVQLGTGSMGWFYTNLTNTGFTINTYNAAGAPTDPASFILTVDAGT